MNNNDDLRGFVYGSLRKYYYLKNFNTKGIVNVASLKR